MSDNIIHNVTYRNLGWDSSADIYLPPDFEQSRRYPAIVSTHPIGSCKEQPAACSRLTVRPCAGMPS